MEFKGYEVDMTVQSLPELEQRALELMLFVSAQKNAIKEAKKELDCILKEIEIKKKD